MRGLYAHLFSVLSPLMSIPGTSRPTGSIPLTAVLDSSSWKFLLFFLALGEFYVAQEMLHKSKRYLSYHISKKIPVNYNI